MSPSVAIVDDDPLTVELLSDVAESAGFVVHSFTESRRYIEEIPETSVVILDLNMPELDGVEVIRDLSRKKIDVPIVIVSGYDSGVLHSVQKLAEEYSLNIVETIQKPLRLSSIRKCLATVAIGETKKVTKESKSNEAITKETLNDAIEKEELELHYQPQVDLHTGQLRGVEALVRWYHPVFGTIYPDEFIPLAEREGLIGKLTEYVVRKGVEQSNKWLKQGNDIRVSINVSADNISSLVLPEQLTQLMEDNQLDSSRLVIEITESALMGELSKSLDILTRLRMKGFSLSIDDFGTGYSSLLQLYRAPFTEMKIDMSFVAKMATDEEALAIVETCILLGKKLKMEVVAEGVESLELCKLLKSRGCDIAQGYYIGKPMNAKSLNKWMEAGHIKVMNELV